VTLGRLIVSWLPVAALFALAPPIGYRWDLPPDNHALVVQSLGNGLAIG